MPSSVCPPNSTTVLSPTLTNENASHGGGASPVVLGVDHKPEEYNNKQVYC